MPEDTLEGPPPNPDPSHTPSPANAKPARSRALRALIWILILAAFAIIFWVILNRKPTQAAAPRARRAFSGPVTLTTVTAKKGDMNVYVQAIGTVTPVHTDTITSQATGMITRVDYREGQQVRQGQRLIQIDPRQYQAQVLAAQGALERDQSLLAQAKMDLQRYQAAWAHNAIAKQTLDDQQKIVMQQEGAVKADQGDLQLDQVMLSYCDITAPISGRVGLRLVDPGNVVSANGSTPLVVITEMQPITVVFTIAEGQVAEVREQMAHGKPLEVDALDRTAQTKLATGKLLSMDNQIDTTTGTLKLRAIFSNRTDALFPNQFVNARLLLKTLHGVVMVPAPAIQHNGEEAFVYLIQNKKAHIQDVKTGVSNAGWTEVTGLNPGDVVADSSFEKLQDGSSVSITTSALLPPSTGENSVP